MLGGRGRALGGVGKHGTEKEGNDEEEEGRAGGHPEHGDADAARRERRVGVEGVSGDPAGSKPRRELGGVLLGDERRGLGFAGFFAILRLRRRRGRRGRQRASVLDPGRRRRERSEGRLWTPSSERALRPRARAATTFAPPRPPSPAPSVRAARTSHSSHSHSRLRRGHGDSQARLEPRRSFRSSRHARGPASRRLERSRRAPSADPRVGDRERGGGPFSSSALPRAVRSRGRPGRVCPKTSLRVYLSAPSGTRTRLHTRAAPGTRRPPRLPRSYTEGVVAAEGPSDSSLTPASSSGACGRVRDPDANDRPARGRARDAAARVGCKPAMARKESEWGRVALARDAERVRVRGDDAWIRIQQPLSPSPTSSPTRPFVPPCSHASSAADEATTQTTWRPRVRA